MKLTQHQLKKIIAEELDSVISEQESDLNLSKQDAKKSLDVAKKTKDMPEMQALFDKLEKDPKFMDAVAQMGQQASSMAEGYREVPDESGSGPTAGMTTIGAMVGSVAGWKVLYTPAGAAALAALAPVYGSGLATAGVIGAAVMAPILLGFILDRVGDAATGRAPLNPQIIKKPRGMK
tara:strand:+ start:290 stop:823 length:534 start_codon:yes stop_codon:yes gene_type:complete